MPAIDTRWGGIHYALNTDVGQDTDGPTLVLIHGAGASRIHWPVELRRFPAAAVYALDLPGHGRSSSSPLHSVAEYADALAAFLSRLDLVDVVLVGHSLGGAIALATAVRASGRCRALVLVATGSRFRRAEHLRVGLRCDGQAKPSGGLMWYVRQIWHPAQDLDVLRRAQRLLREAGVPLLCQDLAILCDFDGLAVAKEVAAPALLVAGALDRVVPLGDVQQLAQILPQGCINVIEGAGHMLPVACAANLAASIARFLHGCGESDTEYEPVEGMDGPGQDIVSF